MIGVMKGDTRSLHDVCMWSFWEVATQAHSREVLRVVGGRGRTYQGECSFRGNCEGPRAEMRHNLVPRGPETCSMIFWRIRCLRTWILYQERA